MTFRNLKNTIALSLKEDLGKGDVTTQALVDPKSMVQADIIFKSPGVVCGLPVVREVFKQINPKLSVRLIAKEGQQVKAQTIVAHVYGSARSILMGERVALNFLSMLSGVSTTTFSYVQAIRPYKAKILDTRKTFPLLRELMRYAVICGGGVNHRFDLSEMAMIKDNHRILAKGNLSLPQAIDKIKKKYPHKLVEVEVDTLVEFNQVIDSKADIVLLDNMTVKEMAQAVQLRNKFNRSILLEASGGINLTNVRSVAKVGVDRISIGALTHHIQSLDVSLDIAFKV